MKTQYFSKKTLALIGVLITILSSSCDRFLAVDPPVDQVSTELVFDTDDAAKSAITGIYSRMITDGFPNGFISSLTGLSADEFTNYALNNTPYYTNALTPADNVVFWNGPYQYIYTANAILEGLVKANKVSEDLKTQLEGEAKFIRAFCYFYLTNLFGDVPLHLSTDYRQNNTTVRVVQSEIYSQIVKDLSDAKQLLSINYPTIERVRPNKSVAAALLARVYLYTQRWTDAEAEATGILENKTDYSLKDDLNQVFLKNSTEAIWQLMPNTAGKNTNDASIFIFTGTPTQVSITDGLIGAFEQDDKRRLSWIGSATSNGKTNYYPFKYKVGNVAALTEYSMIFRLAEQYLIRAEARIQLNKIEQGIEDLNVIRKRARPAPTAANLDPIPAIPTQSSKTDALLAVEKERRIELFSEWGHRWLDLKRTGRANTVLKAVKGDNWQTTDVLYPIPQSEITANPKIIQNDGY